MDWVKFCFLISISSGTVILLLSMISFLLKVENFWPPPSKSSWQLKLFWVLFILFSTPLFGIVILDFEKRNSNEFLFWFGIVFSVFALILANLVSYKLGLKNTSGLKDTLRTEGWYSWSRNPVYTLTIATLVSLCVAIPTLEIAIISSLWIFLYLLAPFKEEPWLIKKYGDEYRHYKSKVRRFI